MTLPTIVDVLVKHYGNEKWAINADGELFWDPTNIREQPTMDELKDKLAVIIEEYPMQLLRVERNKRIASYDWVVIRAMSQGVPISQEWTTFLQALRDLPTQCTPKLNALGELDMSSVSWPVQPTS